MPEWRLNMIWASKMVHAVEVDIQSEVKWLQDISFKGAVYSMLEMY